MISRTLRGNGLACCQSRQIKDWRSPWHSDQAAPTTRNKPTIHLMWRAFTIGFFFKDRDRNTATAIKVHDPVDILSFQVAILRLRIGHNAMLICDQPHHSLVKLQEKIPPLLRKHPSCQIHLLIMAKRHKNVKRFLYFGVYQHQHYMLYMLHIEY